MGSCRSKFFTVDPLTTGEVLITLRRGGISFPGWVNHSISRGAASRTGKSYFSSARTYPYLRNRPIPRVMGAG